MEANLKRCPFCNSHDLTLEISAIVYAIKCIECGCIGPQTTTTIDTAIKLWNSEMEGEEELNESAILSVVSKKYTNWGHNRNEKKLVFL